MLGNTASLQACGSGDGRSQPRENTSGKFIQNCSGRNSYGLKSSVGRHACGSRRGDEMATQNVLT